MQAATRTYQAGDWAAWDAIPSDCFALCHWTGGSPALSLWPAGTWKLAAVSPDCRWHGEVTR